MREMARWFGVATWTAGTEGARASAIIGVLAFVLMTTLGAYVRIPLPWTPVPVTLQTFFVLLAGATLGPALGSLSQATYLVLGAVGLPMFAGGAGGLGYLVSGATTGYLIGFVPAAALIGWMIRRPERPGTAWIFLSMVLGHLTLLAFGVAWLAWSLHLNATSAIVKGSLPFLASDGLKVCAATGLFRGYRRQA